MISSRIKRGRHRLEYAFSEWQAESMTGGRRTLSAIAAGGRRGTFGAPRDATQQPERAS